MEPAVADRRTQMGSSSNAGARHGKWSPTECQPSLRANPLSSRLLGGRQRTGSLLIGNQQRGSSRNG